VIWRARLRANRFIELLGGKVREAVTTKVVGLRSRADKLPDCAVAAGQGFQAMKVKVGLEPAGDVARVKSCARRHRTGCESWAWTPMAAGGVSPPSKRFTIARFMEFMFGRIAPATRKNYTQWRNCGGMTA